MPTETVAVGEVLFGGGRRFALIAGPCIIENDEHPFFMAERIRDIAISLGVPYVFKASFDKANRTSIDGFRGPGLEKGLAILRAVRERFGVPVTTDVHEPHQAEKVAEAVDLLQIPAFLCRQTDLLLACAQTGKPVNVKKGQFLAPWDMKNAVEKIRSAGNPNVIVTERGSSFGYNNLVVDLRSFPILRETGAPVVFDVTHSLQLPGGAGKSSSGQSRFIRELASGGVACGVDGVFMEVHDRPAEALSDGPNSCPLSSLPAVLKRLVAIERAIAEDGTP
ncbi:MAG TPA: 3-deoxy-8-phosphooctulonate synthase [Vicinamibacteria bacterium]|nr:3-deoxy-8-phosphooctulonate synthase [Vicinamibacteria bacterium]